MTGHHDHGNAYIGKHSIVASLTVSEAWSTIIMARTVVASMALEKQLRVLHPGTQEAEEEKLGYAWSFKASKPCYH